MTFRACKKWTIPEFAVLARRIETKVDGELLSEMHQLEYLNMYSDLLSSDGDELVPVGSCVDGSKVTIPGDSGDLDVLVMSNQILLEESLFDYNLHHPAFLHIKLEREHKMFFRDITDPDQGDYLPVYVLKQFHKKLFWFGRIIFQKSKSTGISKDGNFFNVTRNSSVGVERNQLDLDDFFSLGYKVHQDKLGSALTRVSKRVLGMFYNFYQSSADRHGGQRLQTILNDENIQTLFKILGEEGGKVEQDDIKRELKQNLNLNTNPGKNLRNDNKNERQYVNANLLDPKKILFSQRDKGEVAQINTNADSTYNYTDKPYLEQQNREREDQRKKQYKSDVTEETNCTENQLSFRKFKSADFVPALKFKGWPRPAEEWIYRKRMWPPKRIMKEVLDVGCQVVAKRPRVLLAEDQSCCNGAKEDNNNYFRLSFALCEVVIAKEMSEQQLLCWRVLKAYQKSFLKTKPQGITSYHWKNVIFWVFEEFDQSFWDDSHVLDGVQRSLDFMISCLEQRYLPFYFVRRMNLLHGYNETMITDVCTRVRMIRSSPILYLKQFLKFQGMSNVEFISMDHKTVDDVISEKHKTKETNEETGCFLDFTEIFFKTIEKGKVAEKVTFKSKMNKFAEMLRRDINASDDEDKELKYLSLSLVEMFEKMADDDKDYLKENNNPNKAFENLLQYCLKNEKMRNRIHDRNYIPAYESIMTFLSEYNQFFTDELKSTNSFIDKFCDASEKIGKVTQNVLTMKAESDDDKTKAKVAAAISLMEKFSTSILPIKSMKNTTENKRQMDMELD